MTSIASPSPAQTLSFRLHFILDWMCLDVAAKAGRNRTLSPLALLLWPYLKKLAKRFDSLLARIRAGQIPEPRRHPDRNPEANPDAMPSPRPPPTRPRLPRGFGCLLPIGFEMRSLAAQLGLLIADPEMAAILEADPRMARLLSPLCRMLGHRIAPAPAAATASAPSRAVSFQPSEPQGPGPIIADPPPPMEFPKSA